MIYVTLIELRTRTALFALDGNGSNKSVNMPPSIAVLVGLYHNLDSQQPLPSGKRGLAVGLVAVCAVSRPGLNLRPHSHIFLGFFCRLASFHYSVFEDIGLRTRVLPTRASRISPGERPNHSCPSSARAVLGNMSAVREVTRWRRRHLMDSDCGHYGCFEYT